MSTEDGAEESLCLRCKKKPVHTVSLGLCNSCSTGYYIKRRAKPEEEKGEYTVERYIAECPVGSRKNHADTRSPKSDREQPIVYERPSDLSSTHLVPIATLIAIREQCGLALALAKSDGVPRHMIAQALELSCLHADLAIASPIVDPSEFGHREVSPEPPGLTPHTVVSDETPRVADPPPARVEVPRPAAPPTTSSIAATPPPPVFSTSTSAPNNVASASVKPRFDQPRGGRDVPDDPVPEIDMRALYAYLGDVDNKTYELASTILVTLLFDMDGEGTIKGARVRLSRSLLARALGKPVSPDNDRQAVRAFALVFRRWKGSLNLGDPEEEKQFQHVVFKIKTLLHLLPRQGFHGMFRYLLDIDKSSDRIDFTELFALLNFQEGDVSPT